MRYTTRLPPGKPVELLDDNLVRKTGRFCEEKNYLLIKRIIRHFISQPDPLVVPIYQFSELGRDKDRHYTYSYIMERCGILSADERALVDIVGDLWDNHGARACAQENPALLSYKEKFPALFEFLKTVVEQDRYMDLHSGNVMMLPGENYCLVDVEGFVRNHSNDWISG